MEMLPKDTSTIIKRAFLLFIPKGMQRVGDADVLQFKYSISSAEAVNCCGFAIYKEFY